jgi:hypothetical protein
MAVGLNVTFGDSRCFSANARRPFWAGCSDGLGQVGERADLGDLSA